MAIKNTFSPNYSVHPGEFLNEILESVHMEQAELAMRLSITPKHLSNIVNGKASITAKTALALEFVFPDRSARYWLGLQEAYDLSEARQSMDNKLEYEKRSEEWLGSFNIDALGRAGYVSGLDREVGVEENVSSLLRFFGCSSIEAWDRVYGAVALKGCHRWDERGSLSLAWLRKGQIDSTERVGSLPRFDRRTFRRALRKIRPLTLRSGNSMTRELQLQCAEAGVLLSVREPLPTMEPASAAFWLRGTPCVQLSSGLRTNDELWLDFAREASYVLEGKTYEISLNEGADQEIAVEAADEWLVSWERCIAFAAEGDFSSAAIENFANEVGVHPGVIVGMLQRANLIAKDSALNALKTRIEYAIVEL